MTRKYFNALAAELRSMKPSGDTRCANDLEKAMAEGESRQWLGMVKGFADSCKRQNAAFDRERFLRACGVVSE